MKFDTLKVSTRLIAAFGLVVALFAVVGGLLHLRANALRTEFDSVVEQRIPRVAAFNEIKAQLNVIGLGMRNMLIVTDAGERKRQLDQLLAARKAIGDRLDQLRATIKNPTGQELLGKVYDSRKAYVPLQESFIQLANEDKIDEARALLLGAAGKAHQDYFAAVDASIAFQGRLLDEANHAVQADAAGIVTTVWTAVVLAGLVGLAVSAWTVRSLLRQRAPSRAKPACSRPRSPPADWTRPSRCARATRTA